MLTSQDHGSQLAVAPPRKRSRAIVGVALMLLGVALMGYGTHFLTRNGNCSGTGYTSIGPVARCSGNEALYITSVFFLGPVLAVVGWLMASVSGVLWPTFCIAMAVGFITLRVETGTPTGTKALGLVAGVCFAILAVVSVIVTVRKRLNPAPAPVHIAGSGTGLAGPDAAAVPSTSVPHRADSQGADRGRDPGLDPLDTIAKLARLRDSGAITEEEYDRQKTKLLGQM